MSFTWQTLWLLRIVAAVAALFGGVFGFASATSVGPPPVPLQFDQYIHRTNGAPADPINIVFLATSADQAAAAVHQVLGWDVIDGSPMTFSDEGASHPSGWQMGMQFSRSARWHLRIEDVKRDGPGAYVLAAVHRDDDSACGHIGGAFNRARSTVADAFAAAGYHIATLDLGNTIAGRQCDGSYTAGDGTAVVIDLTPPPSPAPDS